MFSKFLPCETNFFDIFEKHTAIIVQAAREFQTLASSGESFKLGDTQRFRKWEHEADALVHECVEALHKTFITPIEREDILHLISEIDNIIDCIEATFDCLVIYKIKATTASLKRLSEILFLCVDKVALIVQGLRNMKNADEIRENCRRIRRFEHEGDNVLRNSLGKLFDEEENIRVLIKLKEIYENLEKAIDSCHKVANIIEGIVLEHV